MINYHSYVLNINDDSLKVSADYNVQFETHEEIYFIEPPKKLVQFISKIFNSSNFDFYKVYFKPMEISKVNRITDYRGIWGFLTVHVFPQHRKFTLVWMQLKMQWYPQRVILSFVAPNPVV